MLDLNARAVAGLVGIVKYKFLHTIDANTCAWCSVSYSNKTRAVCQAVGSYVASHMTGPVNIQCACSCVVDSCIQALRCWCY